MGGSSKLSIREQWVKSMPQKRSIASTCPIWLTLSRTKITPTPLQHALTRSSGETARRDSSEGRACFLDCDWLQRKMQAPQWMQSDTQPCPSSAASTGRTVATNLLAAAATFGVAMHVEGDSHMIGRQTFQPIRRGEGGSAEFNVQCPTSGANRSGMSKRSVHFLRSPTHPSGEWYPGYQGLSLNHFIA